MRRAGLRGRAALPRRVRPTDSRHGRPIAPNRIGRAFEAAAPNQSLSHSLKVERVHHRVHATRAEARGDLFAWIEGFHSTHRLHSALGYRSPFTGRRRAHGGITASEERGQDHWAG